MQTLIQRVMRGGILYTGASILQKAFTAGFIILLSQVMPIAEFGLLMLGITIMNLASLLALCGLTSACPKFMPACRVRHSESWGGIAALGIGLLLAATGVMILFQGQIISIFGLKETFIPILVIAVIGIPLQGTHRLTEAALQAQERAGALFIMEFIHGLLKLLLPALLFIYTKEAYQAMIGVAVSYGFIALVNLLLVRVTHLAAWPKTGNKVFSKVAGFALPSMFIGFSYVLAQQLDRLMIGVLGNGEDVAIYVAASALAMALTVVHTSFTQIFSPIASSIQGNDVQEGLSKAYKISSRWATIASGAGVIIFTAAGPTLLKIFGAEYSTEAAYHTLVILSAYYFVSSLLGPTTQLLQMRGEHAREGVNALVFLVVNIVLNLVLIPKYGYVGAALATLLSSVVRSSLQIFQIYRGYNFNVFDSARLKLAACVITISTLLFFIHQHVIWAVAATLVGLSLLAWLLIQQLTSEEKFMVNAATLKISSAIKS